MIVSIVSREQDYMAAFKVPDFNERTAAARAAKEAALEKLRNKAAPDPAVVAERLAAAEAKEKAAEERREARRQAIEDAKAAKAKAQEEAAAAAAAAAPVERAPTEAEMKAARDARYAARKNRKK